MQKTNMWRLNNMLLNNQWITEEIKIYLETKRKSKNDNPKPMVHNKSCSKMGIYSDTSLPQKTREISIPNLTPKTSRGRRKNKHKVSRRKDIVEIRAEINEIET